MYVFARAGRHRLRRWESPDVTRSLPRNQVRVGHDVDHESTARTDNDEGACADHDHNHVAANHDDNRQLRRAQFRECELQQPEFGRRQFPGLARVQFVFPVGEPDAGRLHERGRLAIDFRAGQLDSGELHQGDSPRCGLHRSRLDGSQLHWSRPRRRATSARIQLFGEWRPALPVSD